MDDRQALVWFKARANSIQRRTFNSTDHFEPPALVKEILAWNERLRPRAPAALRERLFLYKGCRGVTALSNSAIKQMLKAFCERRKMLRVAFPVDVLADEATYEIQFGSIERPTHWNTAADRAHFENPAQRWVDLSEGNFGLALLNDCKHGVDVNVRDVGLTVLRSPIYAHHVPAEPKPGCTYACLDQGLQRFSYALLPHHGSWEQAGTVRHAAELNQPPVALFASLVHDDGRGGLPLAASFLQVEPGNVLVTALKQAEDGGGLVLRAVETTGRATPRAAIRLAGRPGANGGGCTVEAAFLPGEIKTFYLPYDALRPAFETNLIEDAFPGAKT